MNSITRTQQSGGGMLAPRSFEEAWRFAQVMAKSTMVPRDYLGKPENIMVAIQMGDEIGLGPMQAMQNISIIQGRPSVWGDAALALVLGSPVCEYVHETHEGEGDALTAVCEAKRKGAPHPVRVTFGVANARKAQLWGKSGPWQQYPERMLKLRARGFALRDAFPDVLRGVITTEEARDYPAEAHAGATVNGTVETAPGPRQIAHEIVVTPTLDLPSERTPTTATSDTLRAVAEQTQRPAKTPDPDAEWAASYVARLKAVASADALRVEMDAAETYEMMDHLETERPRLAARIRAVETERTAALVETSRADDVPPAASDAADAGTPA